MAVVDRLLILPEGVICVLSTPTGILVGWMNLDFRSPTVGAVSLNFSYRTLLCPAGTGISLTSSWHFHAGVQLCHFQPTSFELISKHFSREHCIAWGEHDGVLIQFWLNGVPLGNRGSAGIAGIG